MNFKPYHQFTDEEHKQSHELRDMFQEKISVLDSSVLAGINDTIASIDAEISKLEKKKQDRIDFCNKTIESMDFDLYSIHYYSPQDIHNNGGVRTILDKDQLTLLLNNQLFTIYIVDLYAIKESFLAGEKIVPDWIDDTYKKMIGNPEFNNWHRKLLEEN